MKIKFTRNTIVVFTISIILLFALINRYEYIFKSKVTTGYVYGFKTEIKAIKNYYANTIPLIKFVVDSVSYSFAAETNMELEPRQKVKIIYKEENPNDAYIYSFTGFWLAPLLYCIIPILFVCAALLAFFSKEDCFVISLGKKFSINKVKNVKSVGDELQLKIPEKSEEI